MRVVLDTNVFVSAAISTGAPHRILQDWLARRPFELIMCPQLLAEVTEVMTERPKLRQRRDQRLAAMGCLEPSEFFEVPGQGGGT